MACASAGAACATASEPVEEATAASAHTPLLTNGAFLDPRVEVQPRSR